VNSLTNLLIGANVAAYLWLILTGNPDSTSSLIRHGAFYGPLVADGEYYRLVTYAFLHGGLMHIGFNMFALYQVGSYVEALLGSARMALVYIISLLGAAVAIYVFSFDSVTVGASGAIFGLFGALVAVGLRLGKRGRALISQTLPIILLNLAIGFAVPNISSAGHLGGLISGFVAGLVLLMIPRRPAMFEPAPVAAEAPRPVEEAGGPEDDELREPAETSPRRPAEP
jgi:rhomboid protease GluP